MASAPACFYLACIADPTAGGDTVEAADDGNRNAHLGLANQLQIAIGTEVVRRQVGKVVQRLRETFSAAKEIRVKRLTFQRELLFE